MVKIKTVKDLKVVLDELIEAGHGEKALKIPIQEKGMYGPSPSVGIQGVCVGFDWNSGTVFVQPDIELKKADALSELTYFKHYYEGLIFDYERGLTPVEDEALEFKQYISWKNWVQTLEVIEFNHKKRVAEVWNLSVNNLLEKRLWNQIKRGDNLEWEIVEEAETSCVIKRK